MHIVSTNFAKTLVWKHLYDVKLWRHKHRTANTMSTICHLMKPSMKIFCARHCVLIMPEGFPTSFHESQFDRWSSRMLSIVWICSKHVGCFLCLLNRTDCYVCNRQKNLSLFMF